MALATAQLKERTLLAVMGDEDTVTGVLLAGVGHVDHASKESNFLVVDSKTPLTKVQESFASLCKRRDVAILLINQHVADLIRPTVEEQQENNNFPVVMEIPSKDHPYDPSKDSILRRIQKLFGND